MATLTVTADEDYSDGNPPLSNITDIVFTAAAGATFAASQFDNVQISQTVQISGDANNNHIIVNGVSGTFVASWSVTNWSGSDTLQIYGTNGADTITGPAASGGFVYLSGGGGADRLIGGGAANIFLYLDPSELVAGEELTGDGVLEDRIWFTQGEYDFSVAVLTSIEVLDFLGQNATVTLAGGQIGAGAIEQVIGGLSSDVRMLIVNGNAVDLTSVTFTLWLAQDVIQIGGTAGADTLTGSSQNDTITGGLGPDALNGDDGNDIIQIAGSEGIGDSYNGGDGTDTLQPTGPGAATLAGFNAGASFIEQWIGNGQGLLGTGAGNVFDFSALMNKTGLPFIDGRSGNDNITGSNFADKLLGGSGIDTLNGGDGNDVLIGGAKRDTLTGGIGRDLFDINGVAESKPGASNRDKITDFKHGTNITGDDIDLRTIDAKKGVSGNNKFKFIGRDDFSGERGELRFKDLGSKVIVQGDVNGDGKADLEVLVLKGSLAASDFLL